jgi:hypothetical protein
MIQPNYGSISSAKILKCQSKVRVETGFSNASEVKKPISIFAKSFITSNESNQDKTCVKAKVAFTFIYLSDDGYKKTTAECDAVCDFEGEVRCVESFITDVKLLTSNGYVGIASVVFSGTKKQENQINFHISNKFLSFTARVLYAFYPHFEYPHDIQVRQPFW